MSSCGTETVERDFYPVKYTMIASVILLNSGPSTPWNLDVAKGFQFCSSLNALQIVSRFFDGLMPANSCLFKNGSEYFSPFKSIDQSSTNFSLEKWY